MKKRFLMGIFLLLLAWSDAAGDDRPVRNYQPEAPPMINIFADKFLARIWPQLPEPYRIMASISASKLVGSQPNEKKDSPAEPLVGISLTIEW
jgi:hypothetical protein